MRKSKDELASIIMCNLDRIDLFSEAKVTLGLLEDLVKETEKKVDVRWCDVLDTVWGEHKAGKDFENWALAVAARRALQKLRGEG